MKKIKWIILMGAIMAMTVAAAGCSDPGSDSDHIEAVQNGYLGEYTDVTVKDLLSGHYGVMYEEELWDGGTSDSGKEIVEVRYQDEDDPEGVVRIQFTMLDEQCFKVSAFVDPLETIESSSDLLAVLNYIYFEQYSFRHEEIVGDFDAEIAFIERLDKISGSAVQYGASADYSGDRGQLCKLFGDYPLETSVPWLLDASGMLDMGYYYPDEGTETDENDDPEPEPDKDVDPEISSSPNHDNGIYDEPISTDGIVIETELFDITVPEDWEGRYICEQWEMDGYGYSLSLAELNSYNDGYGGMLFSIMLLTTDEDYTEFPSYEYLGQLDVVRLNSYNVVVLYPTDVQFSDAGMDDYIDMSADIENIISSFSPHAQLGYTYTPAG